MFSAIKIGYFVLLASKADYKDKLECWYKLEYENQKEKTVSQHDATTLIIYAFEVCVAMLKLLHKTQFVSVELITDENHT